MSNSPSSSDPTNQEVSLDSSTPSSPIPQKQPNTFQFMLMGAMAGLLSDGVVHPIDTIRTNTILRSAASSHTSQIPKFQYSLRSLYRGFSVVSLFTIPAHASYFVSYEKSKEYFSPILKSDNLTYLLSGLIADIFGGLFWCPMDVMKQRFQYHQRLTFKDMFSSPNSLKIIYKGFGTSIAVYGPYVSLYFMLYENLKKTHFLQHLHKSGINDFTKDSTNHSNHSNHSNHQQQQSTPMTTTLSLPHYIIYASMASTVSAIVTTPLDVIKTKVQTLDIYKSPFDVLRNESPLHIRNWPMYMSGWKPRALWMASGTALTMVFYEELKKVIHVVEE
ncbi:hypothetical protein C9374_009637 [Naegleria lovaniensis]|uniref:Mitochondrial carrier protein n=1 Tax=Naegleria lovaniensis TaxID=51637 RepID=A0AA88H1G7_NAELO|nr:uncharacterized protein C9374_009637 [Naegleria lovaniensis]KAG2393060.1 hypothetical protein C9374_009637 [Naegleria lovaniensis]